MLTDPTYEDVRNIFTYDPDDGVLRWRRDAGRHGRIRAGSLAGSRNKEGYLYVRIKGRSYRGSRLIWLYMTGSWPKHQIDHKDRNTKNDKWDNLREATSSQQKQNNWLRKDSSTGYKCVTWDKDRKCYTVRVKVGNKRVRLGRYATAELAYADYVAKIDSLHREFASNGLVR